jgi:hypothetical protein
VNAGGRAFELPDGNLTKLFRFFQDILREKTTHIDQLLKEREVDREDMQTQSMLYQKNSSLVIIRV